MGRSAERSRRRSRSPRRPRSPERGRRRNESPSRGNERRRSPSRSRGRDDRHFSGAHRSRRGSRSRSRSQHRRRSRSVSPRRRSPSLGRSRRSRSRRRSPSPRANSSSTQSRAQRSEQPPPLDSASDSRYGPSSAAHLPVKAADSQKPSGEQISAAVSQGQRQNASQLSVSVRETSHREESSSTHGRPPGSVESTPLRPHTPAAQHTIPEDPVAKRRRERRQEAQQSYLKSATEHVKAQMKFTKMETELQMAELWLEFVGKALEDVGRRTELQDWKFKKIEEGTDLKDLLESERPQSNPVVQEETKE